MLGAIFFILILFVPAVIIQRIADEIKQKKQGLNNNYNYNKSSNYERISNENLSNNYISSEEIDEEKNNSSPYVDRIEKRRKQKKDEVGVFLSKNVRCFIECCSLEIKTFVMLLQAFEEHAIKAENITEVLYEIGHKCKECKTFSDTDAMITNDIKKKLFNKLTKDFERDNIFYYKNKETNSSLIFIDFMTNYEIIIKNIQNKSNNLNVLNLNLIEFLLGFLKACIGTKYLSKIYNNKEMQLVINKYLKNLSYNNNKENLFENLGDLYEIYQQFYIDEFEDNLSYEDFVLIIYLYDKASFNYDWNIIEMSDIDSENLVNKFIESNQSLSDYCLDLLKEPQFKTLIENENYRDVGAKLETFFLYNLLNRKEIYFEEWLKIVFEMKDFFKKFKAYYNRYNLLIEKISEKDIAREYYNIKSGEDFELFLQELYEKIGYKVTLTPKTGDQGADLIMEKEGRKIAVQAKYYSQPVGNKAVQEVVASLNYYGADKGMVVTNNTFTKSAVNLATSNNIELLDGDSLLTLINIASI